MTKYQVRGQILRNYGFKHGFKYNFIFSFLLIVKQLKSYASLRVAIISRREKKQCRAYYLMAAGIVMLLSACVDTGNVDVGEAGQISISVSNERVYLSSIGSQYVASAKLVDEQGVAYVDQPVFSWVSDASSVVTVNSEGVITANALGQTNITVSADGFSSIMQVVVSDDVVTLQGTARYEDKEYNSFGFISQSNYFKAIRFAKVTVVDANGKSVAGVDSVYTDANGKFTISGLLNTQHYVRVAAETDMSLGLDLTVKDRGKALYIVSKQVNLQNTSNFVVDIPLSSDASGAFNILDVFTNAAQFSLEFTGATSVSLATYWEINNSDGTYFCNGYDAIYCNNGKGVYVFNSASGDTDEYDDDVLYHEFAHYLSQAISRDDSYGGCHVLSSTDLDLRLSWSEGWGDFFPAAVKTWLADDAARSALLSTSVNLKAAYIDTYQNRIQIYVSLDGLSTSVYKSAGNELAVAKVLYDLYNQFGMNAIVNVLENYFPSVATPVNLESFWDGWLQMQSPGISAKIVLTSFFNERSIFYQEDNFEEDNSLGAINNATGGLRKATINTAETHYLYSDLQSTDIDYVAFDAVEGVQYTLTTSDLTSGADTYLQVLNADGSSLVIDGVKS